MSFLDAIPGDIYDALSGDFREATLKTQGTATTDGEGGFTYASTEYACRALVDDFSDFRRQASGIPGRDRKIIILAHGLAVDPRPGNILTIEGRDWQVIEATRDPARATFEVQAR